MQKRSLLWAVLALIGTVASNSLADELPLSVCEWVAETAASVNTDLDRSTTDAARSAPFVQKYLLNKVIWDAKSNAPPNLAEPDVVYHSGQQDLYEKHIRWSHDMGYLPFRESWYKIRSKTDYGALRGARSTGAYLSALMGKDRLVCAFDNEVIENAKPTMDNWRLDKTLGSVDCMNAIKTDNIVQTSIPFPIQNWGKLEIEIDADSRPGIFFENNANPWTSFANGRSMPRTDGPVLRIDINNDGSEENLLNINYSSAGNSGCGFFYYDLLSEDMSGLGQAELRDQLLVAQEIIRNDEGKLVFKCGRKSEILSVDGRNIISSKYKLYRHISGVFNQETVSLCKSKFTIKPKVVYDASKIE